MKQARINDLEKKMNRDNRKHRKVRVVHKDNGVFTTRNDRPLIKDKDGSFLFGDGTVHYDANEPNPYKMR